MARFSGEKSLRIASLPPFLSLSHAKQQGTIGCPKDEEQGTLAMRMIRVHRCVDSEILRLPELKGFIGRQVEILVLGEPSAPPQSAPQRNYSALARIAGEDLIDPEAYKDLRAASMAGS